MAVQGGPASHFSFASRDRFYRGTRIGVSKHEDRRVHIRISGKDPDALQKRALEEGLPYQTLISSLIHKFVSGRLQGV
jgi:predicted DNA binding CopG/RHH family protein